MEKTSLFEPIKITNLSQALAALNRDKGSFEEWMECTHIFSAHKMWGELERAAWRALQDVVHRPIPKIRMKEAAKRFASAALATVDNLDEFKKSCSNAKSRLEKVLQGIDAYNAPLKESIDEEIKTLDEILILLSEGSPQAYASIASKLRNRLGRPDLAIIIATLAIRIDNFEYAAYTTRGAAYSEIDSYEMALNDFSVAERSESSRKYAIAGHTKLLIRQSNYSSALTLGSELLRYPHTKPMLFLLATAARGAGDTEKFNWLIKKAEKLTEVPSGTGRLLLTRQSIKILIETKQFELADKLLLELEVLDKPSNVAKLKRELEQAVIVSRESLSNLSTENTQPSRSNLETLCSSLFGFKPIYVDERNKPARFGSEDWFFQGKSSFMCPSCKGITLLVFRKHFKRYGNDMHHWGIICSACTTAKDYADFNSDFLSAVKFELESSFPISNLCRVCSLQNNEGESG